MSNKNCQAHVYLKWNRNWPKNWSQNKSWDWMKEWPEVKSAWSCMGEWDMVLWVETDSTESLEDFISSKVWEKDWVDKTETHWARQMWWNQAA